MKRMVARGRHGTDIRGAINQGAVRALRAALCTTRSIADAGACCRSMQVEVPIGDDASEKVQGRGAGGAAARAPARSMSSRGARKIPTMAHQLTVLAIAAAVVRLDIPEGARS